MENPLISIIVPVYKVEKYLHNCIESVLNQTYSNWELILVNDDSPDGCPKICDEYAGMDKRISVLHRKNGGVASARNAALDISEGLYISFLDGDDFWHTDYLAKLLQMAFIYSADIVQCGFVRGTDVIFPQMAVKKEIQVLDNHSVFIKGYANIIVCAKLYQRNVLQGLRMPAGKYFEDDFTTWKWYYKAEKTVVTSERLYYYTYNEKSLMFKHFKNPCLDFLEAYNERINFFKNLNECDLEDCSRAHLCKAMILSSMNDNLSLEQVQIVRETFKKNWEQIKYSPIVPLRLKVLFALNCFAPVVTRRILRKLRK